MRSMLVGLCAALAMGCAAVADGIDATFDAPERRWVDTTRLTDPGDYDEALRQWRSAEDVSAWIGARFEYDRSRAIALSETGRAVSGGPPPIHPPPAFFREPRGVCVDLARFGVETLRRIDPEAKAAYVMIEFSPVQVEGHTLRRHWLASFERGGQRYFFADSKRPGLLAGPYPGVEAFVRDYARDRGREIVAFREAESYQRRTRARASREARHPREGR